MRSMLKRMKRYLDEKSLVEIEKTKIIRFQKGRGKRKKVGWL